MLRHILSLGIEESERGKAASHILNEVHASEKVDSIAFRSVQQLAKSYYSISGTNHFITYKNRNHFIIYINIFQK